MTTPSKSSTATPPSALDALAQRIGTFLDLIESKIDSAPFGPSDEQELVNDLYASLSGALGLPTSVVASFDKPTSTIKVSNPPLNAVYARVRDAAEPNAMEEEAFDPDTGEFRTKTSDPSKGAIFDLYDADGVLIARARLDEQK